MLQQNVGVLEFFLAVVAEGLEDVHALFFAAHFVVIIIIDYNSLVK